MVQVTQKSPITDAKISDTNKGGGALMGGAQHMVKSEPDENWGFHEATTRYTWDIPKV